MLSWFPIIFMETIIIYFFAHFFPNLPSLPIHTGFCVLFYAQILFEKGADNAVEVVQNEAISFNQALGRAVDKEIR